MWSLNNWSKYYRQTLLFGALQDAQINSVFNKYCINLQGQVGSSLFPLGLLEALIAVWVMRK
jgi:U3 small nucleolar RNA-associated protein 25